MGVQPGEDARRWSAHVDQLEEFVSAVEAELADLDGDQASSRLDDLLRDGGWFMDPGGPTARDITF